MQTDNARRTPEATCGAAEAGVLKIGVLLVGADGIELVPLDGAEIVGTTEVPLVGAATTVGA